MPWGYGLQQILKNDVCPHGAYIPGGRRQTEPIITPKHSERMGGTGDGVAREDLTEGIACK